MNRQAASRSGRFLYAAVNAEQAGRRVYGSIGLDGAAVYSISEGQVAAVVSDVANGKIRPERRHLAAHQNVLRRIMEESTPLPMSFGIIANGPDAIRKALSRNQAPLLEQLRRVEGKMEMGLRVAWNVPNIFEYFVNTHPDLRALRDQFFRGGREPSQNDKIELGRRFGHMLDEDRAQRTETARGTLSPCCHEVTEDALRDEPEVMNLACLVSRTAEKDFEEAVLEAAQQFDDNFCFDYNGPWPPFNFVDVSLDV